MELDNAEIANLKSQKSLLNQIQIELNPTYLEAKGRAHTYS